MSFNNRPNRPAESQFFLKLVTEDEQNKNVVKKFYNTVSTYGPENVMSVFETTTPDGEPAQSSLVHRVLEDGQHEYEIPLVRNLTANEILEVVNQLENALVENDFLLETSTFDEDCCLNEDHDDLYFEPELTEQIATKFAERFHERWLNERLDKGWRVGPKRSDSKKTHPLAKPWSQLPEEHKIVDYDLPQVFVDLMEEFGYTVISHEELNELIGAASKKR